MNLGLGERCELAVRFEDGGFEVGPGEREHLGEAGLARDPVCPLLTLSTVEFVGGADHAEECRAGGGVHDQAINTGFRRLGREGVVGGRGHGGGSLVAC